MGIRVLFLDMQVSLLASEDGGDAIRLGAVLAEAALKELLGHPPESRAGLGELIGESHRNVELRERLGRELIHDLNWLNERRKQTVHFKGEFVRPTVDEGRRCGEIVQQLLDRGGLCPAGELARLVSEAAWKASTPATTSVLKLDRATQRAELDDLLGLQRRVITIVVDGEVGQGHEHFSKVIHWRLRAIPKGQWRELTVDWPAPSESVGSRFAFLIESLCAALGVSLDSPDADPMQEAGSGAWQAALEPVQAALARSRLRLCIRHSIDWLSGGDAMLVEAYLKRVWAPAAKRGGERIVLAFELHRAQAAGMPLVGKAWRISRKERRVAESIARALENLEMPNQCRCSALDELTSVSRDDLVQWFRNERNQPRAAAEQEADAVLAATGGGRFELVAKRIASLARETSRK